jgi:ESCRT-II complex subunit VPS36
MGSMKSSTGELDGDSTEVNKILKDIGFVNVVSKDEAGRDFIKHLANDLFQICQNTLFGNFGGMVPLLDLFYFYNKKRQMELVSPDELYQACQQFQNFGYKAKLVEYPNNIKMVESTSFDA